jgi:hypothetical protein
MISRHTTSAFFDELSKIAEAGEITFPANGSGPGVKPFVRQKGYNRLAIQLEKDAGLKSYSIKAMKAVQEAGRKVVKGVGKVGETVDDVSRKIYVHTPGAKHIVRAGQTALGDPADPSAGQAINIVKKTFLGH